MTAVSPLKPTNQAFFAASISYYISIVPPLPFSSLLRPFPLSGGCSRDA